MWYSASAPRDHFAPHGVGSMVKFRYTCPRHQALFIEILREEGCADPAKMDEARRMVLSWLSEKYPLIVFEQTAHFIGAFYWRQGNGWRKIASIDETGFCEFTGTWI